MNEQAEYGKLVPPYPLPRCAASDCHGDGTFKDGAYLFRDMESGKFATFCAACTQYVELDNGLRFRRVML